MDVPALVDPAEDVQDRRADPRDRAPRVPPAAALEALAPDVREILPAELHHDEGHAAVVHAARDEVAHARDALEVLQRRELALRRLLLALDLHRDVRRAGGVRARTGRLVERAEHLRELPRADRPVPGDAEPGHEPVARAEDRGGHREREARRGTAREEVSAGRKGGRRGEGGFQRPRNQGRGPRRRTSRAAAHQKYCTRELLSSRGFTFPAASVHHGGLGVQPRDPGHRHRHGDRRHLLRRQHRGVRVPSRSRRPPSSTRTRASRSSFIVPSSSRGSSPRLARRFAPLTHPLPLRPRPLPSAQVLLRPEALSPQAEEEDGREEARAREAQAGHRAGGRVSDAPRAPARRSTPVQSNRFDARSLSLSLSLSSSLSLFTRYRPASTASPAPPSPGASSGAPW